VLSKSALVELKRLLEPPQGTKLYGIIDGASMPDFLYLAEDSELKHECLFAGELAPEVERAAPHLIELTPQAELTQKWWQEGWGEHWGILFHVSADESFKAVRRHFRRFLRVQLPDKSHVLFRYYDPRVFRQYLPTCNLVEANTIFGPVSRYFAEDKDPNTLLRFQPSIDGVVAQRLPLPKEPEKEGGVKR
jgi:Domain of unknown function (DUF4123)